jgi:hypothetical protein
MGVVTLEIVEPANGSNHIGTGAIRLRGLLVSSGHPPLFFKWYSSLVPPPPPMPTDAAIRVPAGSDPTDFIPSPGLPLGSQVLTFTAKDVPGESRTELQSVQHAGMAGGPAGPGVPAPCVIHVFIANMVLPTSSLTLSKASSTLGAQAPLHWREQTYQDINRLRYRWRFTPSGPPAGRAAADLVPIFAQLAFDASGSVPVVRYQGPLPGALGLGNYALTLRVESTVDANVGHEVSPRAVVLVA